MLLVWCCVATTAVVERNILIRNVYFFLLPLTDESELRRRGFLFRDTAYPPLVMVTCAEDAATI